MRKVLINLDRSTERLETFYRVNKHIKDVERFSAIEGKGLRQPLKQSGLLLEGVDYSDGALGCALSHAEQWRRAVSSGEALTVIEDDAVFCKNFEEEHKRLLKTLPETWDIILWGYNFDTPLSYNFLPGASICTVLLDQVALRKNIVSYPQASVKGKLFKLLRTLGIVCYSISPKGAQKFLEFCFPIRAMETWHPALMDLILNKGVDNPMAALYPKVDAYVCIPPLVVTANDKETSTVQIVEKETTT